jgi:hypothetical protein
MMTASCPLRRLLGAMLALSMIIGLIPHHWVIQCGRCPAFCQSPMGGILPRWESLTHCTCMCSRRAPCPVTHCGFLPPPYSLLMHDAWHEPWVQLIFIAEHTPTWQGTLVRPYSHLVSGRAKAPVWLGHGFESHLPQDFSCCKSTRGRWLIY